MSELEQITADEAIALAEGSCVLVDVREQWEWDAGHAPNALHIPMGELDERIEELPDDQKLLVICHSGGRSLTVASALARADFDVANVLGGMTAWTSAGGPVVTAPAQPPHA
jgi:rhodanese-related sulfurtransferase